MAPLFYENEFFFANFDLALRFSFSFSVSLSLTHSLTHSHSLSLSLSLFIHGIIHCVIHKKDIFLHNVLIYNTLERK